MPKHEMQNLEPLRIFATVAEMGSFTRAADSLGIQKGRASTAVRKLEEDVGVRLLHRTTRSLALTEEGQRFLENTQPALAALDRALVLARESKDEIAGPLRIVGPKSSFAAILMPLLDEFCRKHPDIQPDVQLDDGIGNWVLDRVDVGFNRYELSPNLRAPVKERIAGGKQARYNSAVLWFKHSQRLLWRMPEVLLANGRSL